MSERIIFNGRIYMSASEMPTELRQIYERLETMSEDENQDGVPDFLQGGGLGSLKEAFGLLKDYSKMGQSGEQWNSQQMVMIKESDTAITVNGKTFRSVEQMPPDFRRIYRKAVAEAVPAGGEIYDEPWRERKRDSYFKPHDDEKMKAKSRFSQENSVLQPVNTNLGLVIVLVLAVLVCAGAGVFFFLSNGNIF
jgi:hypothetical protein